MKAYRDRSMVLSNSDGYKTIHKKVSWKEGDNLPDILAKNGISPGEGWYTGDGSPAVISDDGQVKRLFVKANKYWYYE